MHQEGYLNYLSNGVFQEASFHFTPDTYSCADTEVAANLSAGTLVDLTRMVVEGEVQNAFAIIRPPGHHAEPGQAMGFCLYNNVAVAAAVARKHYGVDRVLIVDWDIHHGNGTQKMFERDASVLYRCFFFVFGGYQRHSPSTHYYACQNNRIYIYI